jgi:hypothetical protein
MDHPLESTLKKRTKAYFGLGTDDWDVPPPPTTVRTLVVLVVVVGIGVVLCVLGHSGIGVPVMGGAIGVFLLNLYRTRDFKRRP